MIQILKKTIANWLRHDPFVQGAAISYFAIFSLPGFLITIMSIAALVFDVSKVEEAVLGQMQDLIGHNTSEDVEQIVERAKLGGRDLWAQAMGGLALFIGMTGLFIQLQKTLNHVWHVEVLRDAPWFAFLIKRVTALLMVLFVAFLLLISLSVSWGLRLLDDWLSSNVPIDLLMLVYMIDMLSSFLLLSVLFGLIYRILPDVHFPFRYAFVGGVVSAVLMQIGEYGLSFYFDYASPQSTFGAAGSIVLLMLWVSFISIIVLLGAEFTRVYTETHAKKISVSSIARRKPVHEDS